MKITLTNKGPIPVPVVADGLAINVDPGETLTLDNPSTVWEIGAKPGVLDGIKAGLEVVLSLLTRFINRKTELGADAGILAFNMTNGGTLGVRVVPGTVDTEFELAPGETRDTTAVDYIELRELSNWNPVENPPPGGGTPN